MMITLFMFYVLYEFFKSDTCEDLNKSGSDRFTSAFGRGRSFVGQKGTNMFNSMGNTLNSTSQRITSPTANATSQKLNTWGQNFLPTQYQNPNPNMMSIPMSATMNVPISPFPMN